MLTAWLLLAAPAIAAILLWGAWGWFGLAVVVTVLEYVAFRRTGRFSARVWRTVGVGRRNRQARLNEGVYLLTVVVGIALLVVGLFGA
jgi:hypothetical protein